MATHVSSASIWLKLCAPLPALGIVIVNTAWAMEMRTITICSLASGGGARSPFVNINLPQFVTGLTIKRKILLIPKREQVLRWQHEVLESGDLVPDEATVLVLTRAAQRCGMCGQIGGQAPLRNCGGCRCISYCDHDCHRQYWQVHKAPAAWPARCQG